MNNHIIVELQDVYGSDAHIANAAWTSTYAKERRDERRDDPAKVSELVRRLVSEGHLVPLESVVYRFWLYIPLFVDRHIQTYRDASQNGLSGRYRTMPMEYLPLPADVRRILDKAGIQSAYKQRCEAAFSAYKTEIQLLKDAVTRGELLNSEFKRAREILRTYLPLAGFTERTIQLNLRSLANFLHQRLSPNAQVETREVATWMRDLVLLDNSATTATQALQEKQWKL